MEKILLRVLGQITDKTDTKLDDLALDIISSLTHAVKYLGAFYIAWQFAIVSEFLDRWVAEASSIAFLILLLLFVTKLINLVFNHKLIDESKMKAMSRTLMPFVRKTIIVLVWIIGIITIISNLGYDVTALVAWAWVWGIAVALAAQKSVANIFGAITILMNKPFKIGDYITINGHTGTVKDIGLSYITLIDRLGHRVMIPNESIISSSIENETSRDFRRADFSIGLIYDTTLAGMQKWVKIIEGILEKYVRDEKLQKYRVNFEAFWDFSLNINVTYFSNTSDYTGFVKEKEEINLEIKKQFSKAKLEMAFPTTEMIIKGGSL
jgi:MscS family membrane protein